ncbi:hypothetical protein BV25DRAFT_1922328 [Artomyces pyxidatus]|uniref:Uncharacterized protein n=1 Tax=Artomyces pyxidatus TaxID=48021 RepID=A0ACB8SEF1_9AGAM|nr:hypothetical protein BV25DRAFT_1922328 [Artomyces pyxidatus]
MQQIIVYAEYCETKLFQLNVSNVEDTTVYKLLTRIQAEFRVDAGVDKMRLILAPLDLLCDPEDTLYDRVQSFLKSGNANPAKPLTRL